ncbi:hypothetical protein CPLU01_05217 [Colletotrichum plurivorum]|uniref:Uncharacterized protein n=1 Tax=Colletotrichum plurivorum TaxID=2175906 RepID=A0A8H6KLX8_9PEZI|nr:hypothetical protein CPLU01_05217 [Colletotrichum plurivorum]
MPKSFVQQAIGAAAEASQKQDAGESAKLAMMDDLGIQRVEDLPLDNTPGRNYSQMPVRRAPRNIENSEALQGYQGTVFAQEGMSDAEALTAKNLQDLGGSSLYRPSAGPSRSYVESRRPA